MTWHFLAESDECGNSRFLQEREAADLAEARRRAEALIQEARASLAKDVEATKATLAKDSDVLANQITEAILRRSAA